MPENFSGCPNHVYKCLHCVLACSRSWFILDPETTQSQVLTVRLRCARFGAVLCATVHSGAGCDMKTTRSKRPSSGNSTIIGAETSSTTDATKFLNAYFEARGGDIGEFSLSSVGKQIERRAVEARERFKRLRIASLEISKGGGGSGGATSWAAKYNKRLRNNRNSAAACRVYREVLRKETSYTLREIAERADKYQRQVEELTTTVDKYTREAVEMRATIARLEATLHGTTTNTATGADAVLRSPVAVAAAQSLFDTPTPALAPLMDPLPVALNVSDGSLAITLPTPPLPPPLPRIHLPRAPVPPPLPDIPKEEEDEVKTTKEDESKRDEEVIVNALRYIVDPCEAARNLLG